MPVVLRERVLWRGELVTLLAPLPKAKRKKVAIRDSRGFPHDVPAGELVTLRDDDTRKTFRVGSDD